MSIERRVTKLEGKIKPDDSGIARCLWTREAGTDYARDASGRRRKVADLRGHDLLISERVVSRIAPTGDAGEQSSADA